MSTAQIKKDFFITAVFSIFTEPVVYHGNDAKFMLCGGTAASKAHRFTERISQDVDLRVISAGRIENTVRAVHNSDNLRFDGSLRRIDRPDSQVR